MKTTAKKYFLYLTVFFTGAVILVIEILGTRVLAPFYGSTIFVWSALISVTLGFLALGYWFGGKLADRVPSPIMFYLMVFLSGVSLVILYSFKPHIILVSDTLGLRFAPLASAALFYGIPFVILGTLSPYAIRLTTKSALSSGESSGSIFAVSTIGSLVGAVASGFFIIPSFSMETIFYGIVFTTSLLAVVGWGVFFRSPNTLIRNKKFIVVTAVLIFGFGFLGVLAYVVKKPNLTFKDHSVFMQETLYESNNFYGLNKVIGVPRALDGKICFLIDGTIQGCVDKNQTYDDDYFPIAALADTLPDEARFLMLGLGLGEYFYYYDTSRFQVDVVDINPAAFSATKFVSTDSDSQGYNAHLEDARSFLRKDRKTYDLIFTDLLSNVVFPDYVFSQEAFSLFSQRLTQDGSFIFSIIGKTNGEDKVVNALMATTRSVFPYVYLYSEHPERFFTYNLIVGRKTKLNLELVNQNIRELTGDGGVGFRRVLELSGAVITDASNPLWAWWTDNLIANTKSVNDLRLKFKRLSKNDFYK